MCGDWKNEVGHLFTYRGGGRGDGEVRKNDGSRKERLEDFSKEYSKKGRKRKRLGMLL